MGCCYACCVFYYRRLLAKDCQPFASSGIVDNHNPDKFQRRMDLVNDLIDECKGCETEKKAVIAAGDVIARHWRELPDGTHAKGIDK